MPIPELDARDMTITQAGRASVQGGTQRVFLVMVTLWDEPVAVGVKLEPNSVGECQEGFLGEKVYEGWNGKKEQP